MHYPTPDLAELCESSSLDDMNSDVSSSLSQQNISSSQHLLESVDVCSSDGSLLPEEWYEDEDYGQSNQRIAHFFDSSRHSTKVNNHS